MAYLIRVPATTANLGPGFDCLGLALELWNEVEVSVVGNEIEVEIEGVGKDVLPTTPANAIYQAMLAFADSQGKTLPKGLRLKCNNHIPLGSGLGSSSAAVVAGILAAEAVLELPLDIEGQLNCATRLEGHPDNIAPCLLGGLVASMMDGEHILARQLPIAAFYLVIVHPYFNFPTHAARAVLPKTVSQADAIFNSSHALFVTEALRKGDLHLLRTAMQDRLHQPYRLPLIPGASTARNAAIEAGAAAVVLSGAGPSLLAFAPNAESSAAIAEAMQKAFAQANLESEALFPKISQIGATVTLL